MDPESGRPLKRFKHESYQSTLKRVHLPPASVHSNLDEDLPDSESHFRNALDHWRQLNLCPAFLRFASQVQGFSASVPLLLHHSHDIVSLWVEAVTQADDDALRALFDLLQKLVHDLRDTLLPSYTLLLDALLSALPRPLSAETFTVLLATFSLLFKHLLGSNFQLLTETWSALVKVLPQCNSEIQRAMAEVWATILRRCRGESREAAVALILRDLESIADSCAWMLVFAFKSVSHTLHTCSSALFGTLLSAHLSVSNCARTRRLMSRVITALIHHCDNPEQFSSISDLLVARFTSITSQDEIPFVIDLVSTACSVRRGSRMTQKHISTILSNLAQNPFSPDFRKQTLMLGAAALIAGEMPVWMGAGRKFIEMSWKDPPLGLNLSGILSELYWGGWRLVELPFTMKYAVEFFDTYPKQVLELLAALANANRLDDVDELWLRRMSGLVQVFLDTWNMSKETIHMLSCIFALSPFLPSLASGTLQVAANALDISENVGATKERNETQLLSSRTFGICLLSLAKLPSQDWAQNVDVHVWVLRAVKACGWCETATRGLVAMLRVLSTIPYPIPLDEIYPSLKACILSHSRSLRLSGLELLTTGAIERTESYEVIKRCLQGENAPLDVQGVRERVLHINWACQVVKDGDHVGADICARWLIAQLKINLRPLWAPATKALATLSQRYGESVWKLVFTELEEAACGEFPETSEVPGITQANEVEREMERSWRDPSALKLHSQVDKWCQGAAEANGADLVVLDRLDVVNYEVQLLRTLGEIATLAARHNADLVRLFLSFASPMLSSKPPRTKLKNWLTLFSKLDNPKAFHQSSTLLSLYHSLLSHPDRGLQLVALTCVLNYKSPRIIRYQENLRTLLDNTKWRDELTTFNIAGIEERDRKEVIDIIIRLFFGLMMERHGRTKGADRRASLLGALGGCRQEELNSLVELMLEPLKLSPTILDVSSIALIESPEKQQIGFLHLLGDVLKRMGSRLVPYWPPLLMAAIKLTSQAQLSLGAVPDCNEDLVDEDNGLEENPPNGTVLVSRSTRTVRLLGIKRFTDFFRCDTDFDFGPYISSAVSAFVSPRLAALDHENTQSPSAILELFYVWSMHRSFVRFLVDHDDRILPKTYACLRAVSVKPAVVSRIFDIIEHVIAMSVEDNEVAELVLKPHVPSLLDALSDRPPSTPGPRDDLLHRQVLILSQIARFISDASQAQSLLLHFLPLLKRQSRVIPEKTKFYLLQVIRNLIPVLPGFQNSTDDTYLQTYQIFSRLFLTLRGGSVRIALLEAFDALSTRNTELRRVCDLLHSLNAFSVKRLDEPDFDRRLQAFTELNESVYALLSPCEWQPILFNMLHFVQDPEELAVRTNAAFTLRRFIDVFSSQESQEVELLFTRILYPGLRTGLLSKAESVRSEVLGVLAYGILHCSSVSSLAELRPLLANGDAEANFFNNIHHIQVHRRTRAIRRLVEYVESEGVRSTTCSDIFVPLIGHFIMNAPNTDHILVDVTIKAVGSMAGRMKWGAYNSLVRQYAKLIKEKTSAERACVRALVAILENFHFPMDNIVMETDIPGGDPCEQLDEDAPPPGEEEILLDTRKTIAVPTKKIADIVNTRLLPGLLHHLERKDENEDALRIPVSIGIVQVARHLPQTLREVQISRLVTILCQAFRSKSHETRVLTRDTLCKIAVILGPPYISQIITELRAALLRGPHLHVLATVVHALLVHITSPDVVPPFENLDACAADVAYVSAEVIFGQSGRDVHAEGFKTTIIEVHGSFSKGMDSFAILAKYVTPTRISVILSPLRGIMRETEASKLLQIVDDLLRRISAGLNANAHLTPSELLQLCHTLIQQNARFLKEGPRQTKKKEKANGHFIVQMKRSLGSDEDHYAHNSFRFVTFGLDLFNTAFRRGHFDYQDLQIASRLEPMVAVIGNTLFSQDSLVVTQGLKATAFIIKCPLKSLEKSLPVFVRQILQIVRQAGNADSEVVQSAFRTLTVIIRDCATSQVQEKDLMYLLELLTPDLEEPNKQAAVFGLLRAIVSRKFVVVEIYDIMDKVAEIMVTNQSAQMQELCRVVLLQFFLDYPQGKGRLHNQMAFLAQNLSYVYESGRLSVMELLSAIFAKFDMGLLREYTNLFFVSLVMVIANDDSSKCREMAAELIKLLLTQLDAAHRRTIISHLQSWSSQKTRLQLLRVSAQVYGLVVDTLQKDITPYLPSLLDDINEVLRRSAVELEELESGTNEAVGAVDMVVEWQLPYHALNVIGKVLQMHPELMRKSGKIEWPAIGSHLLFPHAWVRSASSRLIGLFFNTIPPGPPDVSVPDDNFLSLSGLLEVARRSSLQLKSDTLDSTLSLQVVKNLFYIGKCFCTIFKPRSFKEDVTGSEEDQEAAEGGAAMTDDETDLNYKGEDKLDAIRGNPLPWLFSKLSYQARSAWIVRRNRSVGQDNWAEQLLAIFRWFAAMASYMEPTALEAFLVHILSPVYRVIDDDTVRDTQIGDLRALAQELVELVQSRVGTSKFAEVYNQIRQGILAVRRDRKKERVVEATVNPQLAARRKIKRNAAKKDNRARKDRMFADRKIRNNRTKRRRPAES